MPWTAKSFAAKHNHSLSGKSAEKAAAQANAILEKTGDEGLAIAVANKHAEGPRYRYSERANKYVRGGLVKNTHKQGSRK